MKKLAGTRAGKPYYVAVDVEMAMQVGARLFRTDEAIMTPDWLPYHVPDDEKVTVYNGSSSGRTA
jgi:RNA:NAD 2'-phosphotransferase (TPT1/KptA family)